MARTDNGKSEAAVGASPSAPAFFGGGAPYCRSSHRADSNLQTAGAANERALLTSRKIALEVNESDIGEADTFSSTLFFFARRS
jgi:hypothetical protein